MSDEIIKNFTKNQLQKDLPDIRPGQTIRVHQRIKEGDKERVQVFEGIVIGRSNGKGVTGTFTVRKVSDGIGVEKIFPLHMPSIEKIEIVKTAKVRHAKLYYLRDKDIKMKEDKTRHEKHVKKIDDLEALRKKEDEEKAKLEAEEKDKADEDAKKAEEKKDETKAEDKKPEEKTEEKTEDKK